MYVTPFFPEDGSPKPASAAGTYRLRHETIESAKVSIENAAKAQPGVRFTAWVLDEETGAVVCWCKYEPRPIVEWIDPSAVELQRMMKLQ